MLALSKGLRKILIFTAAILILSVAYYIYARIAYPLVEERETLLSELGEGLGEFALWALIFIYIRTVLKLILGKGAISKRILPEFTSPINARPIQKLLNYLDRTHIYVGSATVIIILLHIVLSGIPMHILFFPAVLFLVIWQAVFGLIISWRYSPKELKKLSYLVHAQLFTGIMMGVFAYFGHMLID